MNVDEIIRLTKELNIIEDKLNNPFYIRDIKNKVFEAKDYVGDKIVKADKFIRKNIWES